MTAPDTDPTLTSAAHRLADASVITDIESEGFIHDDVDGQRWYDTRPMLDPREHCDEVIDQAALAIGYALDRGLVERHPDRPYLLRIVRRPA